MIEDKPKLLLEDIYHPGEEIREEIFDVYTKFIQWRSFREQPFKQFSNQTLSNWLDDARKKFWGFLPLSYDDDAPQFFFPETRNQITGILAKIANLKLKPSFDGVEGFDVVKSTLLKDLFEHWRRSGNRRLQNFWQFLYAIINGTAVVYVGWRNRKKNVRNITRFDSDTGEAEWKEEEIDESDVAEVIVNLEDLYIPKVWEPDIQAQDELIWRTLIKYSDFKRAFKGYSNSEFVMPGQQFSDRSIFSQFITYDVRTGDMVEVLKYFNSSEDKYMIVANGVLLNPVTDKKTGKQVISPMPWNHKQLPFAKTIFEPLDTNFFFGIPLAQKVKSPQEALNRMYELMLEREIRSVSSPIITNDPSAELGLEFKAGRIYQVQAPVDQFKELKVDPSSGSAWNTINSLQGLIQRTGSGGVVPVSPSRQPRSATENQAISNEKKEAVGLYNLFYQDLLEQKVWLVLQNMIQFYTADRVEKTIGSKKFHHILSISGTRLYGGGQGNREIRITEKPSDPDKLHQESYLRSLTTKEKVEIIEVSPDALRQLKFDIKIGFEAENSPDTERLLYLNYVQSLMNMFGSTGLLSPQKILFRLSEKFGESISDIVDEPVLSAYEQEAYGIKSAAKTPMAPAVQAENQKTIGAMTGAQGPAQRMVNQGASEVNQFQG